MAKIPEIEIKVVYDFSEMKEDSEEKFIINAIPMFPHCDSRVLHRPGICKYCDNEPQWQALRMHYGINFTGESDKYKLPCPSERYRSAKTINRWPGNRPNGV